jgi:hypothetical protein
MGAGKHLAPGVQPYDGLNGVRIGALVGGILGVVPIIWWPTLGFGSMIAGAAVGGTLGYRWQRRDERRRR